MKRDEYIQSSRKAKVEPKCPIYNRCERCAYSLYFLSGAHVGSNLDMISTLSKEGIRRLGEDEEMIEQVGDTVTMVGGKNNLYFANVCPEVPLFSDDLYPFIPKKSVTKGSWDKYYGDSQFGEDGKFKIIETAHYTECREFHASRRHSKRHSKLSPPIQYVYLMVNKRSGHYKIGRSVNPEFRERTLQSQEPEVEMVEACLAPKALEKRLHEEYKSKRIRGEWFDLNDADIRAIIHTFSQQKD